MLRVVVLPMLACGACFAEPGPFEGGTNVRSGPSVVIEGDSIVGRGMSEGFMLTFSPTGVKLPASLLIGAQEVFAKPGCGIPSPLGTAILPLQTVHGGVVSDETKNVRRDLSPGPAFAKIEVDFEVPYLCNGQTHAVSGTSRFIAYPSGRIVRYDTVQPTMQTLDGNNCGGCGGLIEPASGSFPVFRSFWRFEHNGVTRVEVDAMGREMVVTGDQPRASTVGCARYSTGGHGVAVRWDDAVQATTEGGSTEGLAFNYNFFATTSTMIPSTTREMTSAIFAGADAPCSELLDHTRMPELGIHHGDTVEALQLDPTTQHYTAASRFTSFEIRTQDGSGFEEGFMVELPNVTRSDFSHVAISRRNGGVAEVQAQFVDEERRAFFWFDDGIEAGDAIVVDVL